MTRRMYKRALSTIVTGAILLSAVAIMGSMVVTWAALTFSQNEEALQVSFANNINKLNEDITIESVWFDDVPDPNIVNITLSNIGTIGLNITEIDFIEPDGTHLISTVHISDGGVRVSQVYSVNVTYNDWTVDKPFNVFLTTDRDNFFITQVMP